MDQLIEINVLLNIAAEQIDSYNIKQTKAGSARIRKTLGTIKNQVTAVRAALVAEDKA